MESVSVLVLPSGLGIAIVGAAMFAVVVVTKPRTVVCSERKAYGDDVVVNDVYVDVRRRYVFGEIERGEEILISAALLKGCRGS